MLDIPKDRSFYICSHNNLLQYTLRLWGQRKIYARLLTENANVLRETAEHAQHCRNIWACWWINVSL